MKTILVTGAAGYIGSITTDLLLAKGYKVIAVDNLSKGHPEAIEYLQKKYGKEKITLDQLDLRTDKLDPVFKENNIQAILHFAAFLDVGESWKIPEKYITNNVCGTQNLVTAAMRNNVRKIVFSSSGVVYGDAQYVPMDEEHPIAPPASPYGTTKQICEQILSCYAKCNMLQYVFLRYFNVCGAADDSQLGDAKNPPHSLVQNCIRGALGIQKFELNFTPVDTPDSSPIRDYVNVVDLGRAHVLALEYMDKHPEESNIFNLGTGTGNSVLEIVNTVKKITGVDFPVSESTNRRLGEATKMIADITKAKKVLDWEPQHSIEDSVRTLVEWYKKHPRGW